MPELLNRISAQLTEWWAKFSNRQKIAIIATAAVAIAALAILVVVLNQPNYVLLEDELDTSAINERVALLDGADISYRVGNGATSIEVEAAQLTAAKLALARVGIVSAQDMTYVEAFNSDITTSNTTEALKHQLYAQAELARGLEDMLDVVDEATVTIVIPDFNRALFEDQAESSASVYLKLNDKITDGMVAAIAKSIANAVVGLDTANITIIDSDARLLYDGEAMSGDFGGGISGADYKVNQELIIKNKVRQILLSGGEYNEAMVAVELAIDFDQLEKTTEEHTTQDGTSTGIIGSESSYESTSENTAVNGGPGTDSNGATDTLVGDSGNSSQETSEYQRDYVYDTTITKSIKAIGGVKYDESAITVTLNKYVWYNQELMEANNDPLLQGKTWEQFKQEMDNQGNTKIATVDPDIERMIQNASNIDNVVVVAYEVPKLVDKVEPVSLTSDYLLIGIIVLMILLLGYAVYKGTEPVEIKEIEPELSVEDMLVSTKKDDELESIEFDGKSEARVQIEEFVEKSPDAVALLLRNWLNEDWE